MAGDRDQSEGPGRRDLQSVVWIGELEGSDSLGVRHPPGAQPWTERTRQADPAVEASWAKAFSLRLPGSGVPTSSTCPGASMTSKVW